MTRVLLVDDDSALCETLAVGLRKRGLDATCNTSPSDALRLLEDGDFDVVVTDLNMREMSGIDLCERVAQNRPAVPVVVITAFGSLDTAVAAIRAAPQARITRSVKKFVNTMPTGSAKSAAPSSASSTPKVRLTKEMCVTHAPTCMLKDAKTMASARVGGSPRNFLRWSIALVFSRGGLPGRRRRHLAMRVMSSAKPPQHCNVLVQTRRSLVACLAREA